MPSSSSLKEVDAEAAHGGFDGNESFCSILHSAGAIGHMIIYKRVCKECAKAGLMIVRQSSSNEMSRRALEGVCNPLEEDKDKPHQLL